MLLALLLSVASSLAVDDDTLVRQAIATAREARNRAELFRPYLLDNAIFVETPFIRVALQAREAMDRYIPFAGTDVNKSLLKPALTIAAYDEKRSFKHLVIAVPPPGAPAEPQPSTPPLTYEEALRHQKEARRKRNADPDAIVKANVARARAIQERNRREREAREAMTIVQPTAIEPTEHLWQNAFSATFKTTGVRATFPMDVLAAGNQIRAILDDGSELTVDLTPKIVEGLR